MGIANQAHVAKSCSLVCVFFIQRAWFAREFGQRWAPATCSEIRCSLDHRSHTERHLQARLLRGYRFFFFFFLWSLQYRDFFFLFCFRFVLDSDLIFSSNGATATLVASIYSLKRDAVLQLLVVELVLSTHILAFPDSLKRKSWQSRLVAAFFFFFCMHDYLQTHGQLHSVQLVVPKKKKKKTVSSTPEVGRTG